MGFDPKKLDQAKREFDPAKLEQAKQAGPDNPGEAGAPETGSFSSDYLLPLKYARDYALKEAPNVGAAILASKAPVPVLKGLAGPLLMPVIKGAYQAVAGSGTEWLKQHLGITPPDEKEIIMAGAVPAVTETGAQAVKLGTKFGPRSGPTTLSEQAPQVVKDVVNPLKPNVNYQQVLQSAGQAGLNFDMSATKQFLDREISRFKERSTEPHSVKALENLRDKITTHGNQFDLGTLDEELQTFTDLLRSSSRQAGTGGGALKEVKNQLNAALDQNLPGQTHHQIRRDYMKLKAADRITQAADDTLKFRRGQGENQDFNASNILNDLKDDPIYQKAFHPHERADIEKTLQLLNTIPPPPTPRGVNAGSMRMLQRLTQAGAAAGGANAMGHGPVTTALAGATGFLAKDAADLVRNISIASKTGPGRALIREMAKDKGGFWSPRTASVIGAYVNALQAYPNAELAH